MTIQSGTYRISSVASSSTVRSYKLGETIFVASTREFPGPFQQWQIEEAVGGYLIKNHGLKAYCLTDEMRGCPVRTGDSEGTVFEISREDEETYVIKMAYADLLWTVEEPVIPRGDITLQPAQGLNTQKFQFFRD